MDFNLNVTDNNDHTVTFRRDCRECGDETVAVATKDELLAYSHGAFVQQAFPSLTADQREALFLSGICSNCWDKLFADDEDDFIDDQSYIGDNYYSGTGELVGDDSYIDYLNR